MTLAYRGTMTKAATLKQLRDHAKMDQIIQGTYWTGNGEGKGCAVGCLTHDSNGGHDQFPDRWGVPENLAYLMDQIFESLPTDDAKVWPIRIMSAIKPGSDLSGVWDRWALWMLRDLLPIAGSSTQVVADMVTLFERATHDDEPSESEWAGAAWAAWAARAARAARAAWAAPAARAAGEAREAGAAGEARAARAAGAAWAAWAARAARAARAAARHEWARRAADEFVRLVKAA